MRCAFIKSILYPDAIDYANPPHTIYEVDKIEDIDEASIKNMNTDDYAYIFEVNNSVSVGMIYDPHDNTLIDYKWCYISHPYKIIKGGH